MFDVISYVMSKSYTDKSILGISGALAGKNCTIESANKVDGVTTIVFKWTADDGTVNRTNVYVDDGEDGVGIQSIAKTSTSGLIDTYTITYTDGNTTTYTVRNGKDGEDGISVTNAEINANNHLIITLSDSTTIDCGEIKGATNLNELLDVDLSATLANGQVLTYNATTEKWENKELDIAVNIEDLENVSITSPTNGQTLVYDATNHVWKNQDGEVVADLTDLQDVNIVNPQNNQILVYDVVNHVWKNGSPSTTDTSLDDLSNVNIDSTTLTNGQVIVYDSEHNVWINANTGAVIHNLDDIEDVDLYNLANGDTLTWDNINHKWINTKLDNVPTQYSENMINSGAVYASEHAITQKIGDLTQLTTTDKTNLVGAINEVDGEYGSAIGDLTQLTTTDKTSLVNAINEVDSEADTANTNIGDLTHLTTTAKSNLVLAINEVDNGIKTLSCVKQLNDLGIASDLPNAIVEYIGATNANYTKGYFYYSEPSVESGVVVYNWVQMNVQPTNNDYENLINLPQINDIALIGNKTLADLGIQGQLQYSVMPTPSNALVGKIAEYTGATTATLKTGYFYRCQYVTENDDYEWVQIDISSNSELASRISNLETNQGDMSQLEVAGVSDLVSAINVLNVRGIKSITYSEPYLTITLQNDDSYQFDLRVILNATDLGDLGNVIDTTIANTNVLQYDSSILKYKPYDVVGAMVTLLQDAKDYTDTEIGKINLDDAFYCDAKPSCSYDSGSDKWIVVYYQASQVHTSTDISARYYYKDANQDPYCTSWFLVESGGTTTAVELTYLLSSVNLDDFVNKNTDIVSTYAPDMADKTKVPNISSMDALYALIVTALGAKVNTADIVDALTSDDATVPLSAKQGKVLNLAIADKQNIIQYSVLPTATESLYNSGVIYQYTGADSGSFRKGRFYTVVSDGEVTPTYSWTEIKFSADYDTSVVQGSTNAPQGNAVYVALQDKQDKTLATPIVVEGTNTTTVETALGALNTLKSPVFFYSTMPQSPTVGMIVLYTGADTQNFTQGCFYRYEEVSESSPVEYHWVNITPRVTTDSTMSITSTNPIQNSAITGGLQALQNGVIVVYADEQSLLQTLDYASGQIVSVGTIGYCVSERSWHKVSAINGSTLAVTWVSYDPHLASEVVAGDGIEIDPNDNNSINVKVDGTTTFVDGTTNELQGLSHDTNDFDVDTVNKVVSLDVTQRTFTGTTAEWDNLTTAQKAKYLIVNLTDDIGGGITVVNVIANNNMNVPTSNAVYRYGQPKTLSSPITLNNVSYTTVESLLSAMATMLNEGILTINQ